MSLQHFDGCMFVIFACLVGRPSFPAREIEVSLHHARVDRLDFVLSENHQQAAKDGHNFHVFAVVSDHLVLYEDGII